ncbi:MAG: hypothetical protein DI598_17520 [Pseudopedobacter saltans]|uniref:Uncharacterized protein n=1 Tax=Pseudopedobacter saltans TaxID=151895 RepID=A0A2W5G8X8_9SPHI|nr:MAG: hypothetical protein DI598_17520 [Pseudopedobacter saltans]
MKTLVILYQKVINAKIKNMQFIYMTIVLFCLSIGMHKSIQGQNLSNNKLGSDAKLVKYILIRLNTGVGYTEYIGKNEKSNFVLFKAQVDSSGDLLSLEILNEKRKDFERQLKEDLIKNSRLDTIWNKGKERIILFPVVFYEIEPGEDEDKLKFNLQISNFTNLNKYLPIEGLLMPTIIHGMMKPRY